MAINFGNFGNGAYMTDVRDQANNPNTVYGEAAKTPQYVITCTDFFDSTIEGMTEDTSPCISVTMGSSRNVTIDSTDEIFGSGRVVAAQPIVEMKYGSWAPLIQQALANGQIIGEIVIKRLTSAGGTKVILQETTFTTCCITNYKQEEDRIFFSFSFLQVQDISKSVKPDGSEKGSYGFSFNYGTLKVEEVKE